MDANEAVELLFPIRYYADSEHGLEVVISFKVGSFSGIRVYSRMQQNTGKVGRPRHISSGEWPYSEICPYWPMIQDVLIQRKAIRERDELRSLITPVEAVNDKRVRRL